MPRPVRTSTNRPFRAFSGIDLPVGEAMDIGCGTGQSTRAVARLARHTLGIDPSASMLGACEPHPTIDFRCSAAETLPVPDSTCDLMVVAQAFHWFDQEAFLAEARRVLAPGSWLLIYNAWFTGEMKQQPTFASWFKEAYLTRYPSPPRNTAPLTSSRLRDSGVLLCGEESFDLEIPMTISRFTDYQLSTTNVIAAVHEDLPLFREAEQWITGSIQPFFDGEDQRTFKFSGRNWYLRKTIG